MAHTMTDLLNGSSRQVPDRPAAVDGGRTVTYGELGQRVHGLAKGIGQLVAPGGSVTSLLGNSLEHMELWLGVPMSGRVICDLNTRLTDGELGYMATDAAATTVVCDASTLDAAARLRDGDTPVKVLVYVGDDVPPGAISYDELVTTESGELVPPGPNDIAGIFYTGGTTGTPKGVLHTHNSLFANAQHLLEAHPFGPEDRFLHAAPMFHLADGSFSLASTAAGVCHYFLPGFSPTALAEVVTENSINQLLLVPSMVGMLLADPVAQTTDWSCVDRLFYGASPMPAPLQQRVSDLMDSELIQMYGFTEGGLATDLDAKAHRRGLAGDQPWQQRLRSAGRALDGVAIRVRADGSGDQATGEVQVQGPNIMAGYHGLAELTSEVLDEEGWYSTGDVGYLDEDGYLFIVDRAKDMIITGAENVYCPEVESVLMAHPAVVGCAVIGIPDETWGETVHAFVETAGSVSLDELDAHCRHELASYKIPRSYELRTDPLPRSAVGKILKTELREPFWQGHERRVN